MNVEVLFVAGDFDEIEVGAKRRQASTTVGDASAGAVVGHVGARRTVRGSAIDLVGGPVAARVGKDEGQRDQRRGQQKEVPGSSHAPSTPKARKRFTENHAGRPRGFGPGPRKLLGEFRCPSMGCFWPTENR